MTWGTCYSGSNNIHFDFPPIMADGRNYSSWEPNAVMNKNIRETNNITSNWQYRKYLTENADTIIEYNQQEACNQCGLCPAIYGASANDSNVPYLYKSSDDTNQPMGYENSDLKTMYLTKEQIQSRMITPTLTQAELLQRGIPNWN